MVYRMLTLRRPAGSLAAQTPNSFLVHNLVSDLPNIADHQDANLKNAWGNGFGDSRFGWQTRVLAHPPFTTGTASRAPP